MIAEGTSLFNRFTHEANMTRSIRFLPAILFLAGASPLATWAQNPPDGTSAIMISAASHVRSSKLTGAVKIEALADRGPDAARSRVVANALNAVPATQSTALDCSSGPLGGTCRLVGAEQFISVGQPRIVADGNTAIVTVRHWAMVDIPQTRKQTVGWWKMELLLKRRGASWVVERVLDGMES
jgi:hypothetical protein